MTEAATIRADLTPADFDAIDREPSAVDGGNVAVPVRTWNAIVVVLGTIAESAMDPVAHLGWDGDRAMYKPSRVGDQYVVGEDLDARLDQWTSPPDEGALSADERERRLYVQATAHTLWTMGQTARTQPTDVVMTRTTGWIQLLIGAGAALIVASVSICAWAWYRSTVDTEAVRVKADQHRDAVTIAQAGRDYQARLAERVRSGTMPPPSEVEQAARATVERAAAQHREQARDSYIGNALREMLGGAVGAARDAVSTGAKVAAVVGVLWLVTTSGKKS